MSDRKPTKQDSNVTFYVNELNISSKIHVFNSKVAAGPAFISDIGDVSMRSVPHNPTPFLKWATRLVPVRKSGFMHRALRPLSSHQPAPHLAEIYSAWRSSCVHLCQVFMTVSV